MNSIKFRTPAGSCIEYALEISEVFANDLELKVVWSELQIKIKFCKCIFVEQLREKFNC